ncbi:hypothetical protein SELMODRAFT_72363, partial [Selaginella moellendorffii]
NALLVAFARSGDLEDAKKIFDRSPSRDLAAWNTMAAGFSQFGRGGDALESFHSMLLEGMRADEISVLHALIGCNHLGLVENAGRIFASMAADHRLAPWIEHYSVMAEALGRSCEAGAARELVDSMPYFPDKKTLGGL